MPRQGLTLASGLVVPLAGTWIEIGVYSAQYIFTIVVPLAGTWIEIIEVTISGSAYTTSFPSRERGLKLWNIGKQPVFLVSFPSRERGLKSSILCLYEDAAFVVPLAGTWIEIEDEYSAAVEEACRSPRGNVD